ncbi:MAG TPA: DUF2071 domain-containing protein [Pirellulaceae bacterium]|nr:DUF2071 domain-containing protein [Pirellulaceae bacterium]
MISESERIAPTHRPNQRVSLRQRWAELLFLHWEVEAEAIQRLLPPGLTVDTYDGKAYVGLVPFTMTGIRPTWAPAIWGLSSFHEINVRTYVHCEGKHPGVWFFSLDAAHAIAVWIGRTFWHLNYCRARMSLTKDRRRGRIDYRTERLAPRSTSAIANVAYTPSGVSQSATVGTLEYFFAERYIMYVHRQGNLYLGRVHHVPYPLQTVTIHHWEENLLAANGVHRGPEEPSALYVEEVNVEIFPLCPVERGAYRRQVQRGE